jgi:hypothetical protein
MQSHLSVPLNHGLGGHSPRNLSRRSLPFYKPRPINRTPDAMASLRSPRALQLQSYLPISKRPCQRSLALNFLLCSAHCREGLQRPATSGSLSTRPARWPASPASGPTGRRSGRSRKARPPTTSTHSSRRSRTPRWAPSTRRRYARPVSDAR